ncbi:MAG TPA: DUF1707 domain-containing protein [Acidimicrobiales bacterium]|nr:DUF1707 domain-containing protein [Acidimicrobiales bacterium]
MAYVARYQSWRKLRASDADRDQVASELREHCAAGRVTVEELSERLDQVFRARTFGDLASVMHDLPPLGQHPAEWRRPRPGRLLALALVAVGVLFALAASSAATTYHHGTAVAVLVALFVLQGLRISRARRWPRAGR